MRSTASKSEEFLASFHDSNPGVTSRAFAQLAAFKAGVRFSSSYECLAQEVLKNQEPGSLLDLACGDGYLLSLLEHQSHSKLALYGVDLSKGELAAARKRLTTAVTLKQDRAHSLSIDSGTYDYVVSHMALMIMENVDVVLDEIHRVLKPGGFFAAIVGARPPACAVLDTLTNVFSQFSRRAEFTAVRFGDKRMRSPAGITELLAGKYQSIETQELVVPHYSRPTELFHWFEDTYDYHLLNKDDQGKFKAKFIEQIAAQCDSDGKIHHRDLLYLITARAS